MVKTKTLIIVLLIVLTLLTSCVRSDEIKCNYDGVCDDWETDDCPDCRDVLGRGVQIIVDNVTTHID